MMTELCPVDHFRDPERPRRAAEGARLCHGCLRRLEEQLTRLPVMFDDVLAKKIAGRTAPASGTKDPPAVVTHEQIEARWLIHNTLAGWSRVVDEERSVTLPEDTIAAMCAFLRRHSLWLTAHDAAGEFADSIDYAHREAHRIAYPSKPERTYIGDCPVEIEHPDGELGPCGERLYAYPDQPEVECSRCGTKDTIDEWMRQLVGEGHIVTGATLAALLSARYYQPFTPAQVRLLVSRSHGKVQRVDTDELGRALYDFDAVTAYTDTVYARPDRSA